MGDRLPWDNEVEFLQETVEGLGQSWVEWRRVGGWWPGEPRLTVPEASPFGSLAPQLPVFEGPSGDYPYHLHIYPSISLGDGRGANKPWLQEVPDPMTTVAWQTWIEIHPETAAELGLDDGDVVRVVSPAGAIEAIVYRYLGVLRNVVSIAVGRGHLVIVRPVCEGHGRESDGNPGASDRCRGGDAGLGCDSGTRGEDGSPTSTGAFGEPGRS